MAHNHDTHMDGLFHGYLALNGISKAGAKQIILEQMVSDPSDRKVIYELLREYILPEATSQSKSNNPALSPAQRMRLFHR